MYIRNLLGAILFVALNVHAQGKIDIIDVTVTGYGKDYKLATLDALDNAVSQVTGAHLESSTSSEMQQQTKDDKTSSSDSFKQNINKLSKGVIKSYQILEQGKNADSGLMMVKIQAQIPRYEQSGQMKRLRLAVTPISILNNLLDDSSAIQFAEQLSSATEAYLTQTRRFAMLDRRYSGAVEDEKGLIRKGDMPIEEMVKLTAKAASDYIVVLVLKDFSQNAETITRPNGRVMERINMPVTVDIRVIDVPTHQIKFAQTYNHRGRTSSGKTIGMHATDIAQEIGENILNAIYPIAVIAVEGKNITLNQGGITVKNGRQYKLVKLGAPMVDPYTKESLGRQEVDVGVVEISGVTSQMSTAKLISGNEGILGGDSLQLRPIPKSSLEDTSKSDSAAGKSSSKKNKSKDEDDD
jgi:hypothetical protein